MGRAPKTKKPSSLVDGAVPPPRRPPRAARAAVTAARLLAAEIHVSDAATKAERAEAIAARLLASEISLSDALTQCFLQGLPVPLDVQISFHAAVAQYQQGEVEDLAVPFGIAKSYGQRKQSPWRWRTEDKVKFFVDWAHKEGLPLSPPDGGTYTAFHAAAAELKLSPATVHRYYYSKPKRR